MTAYVRYIRGADGIEQWSLPKHYVFICPVAMNKADKHMQHPLCTPPNWLSTTLLFLPVHLELKIILKDINCFCELCQAVFGPVSPLCQYTLVRGCCIVPLGDIRQPVRQAGPARVKVTKDSRHWLIPAPYIDTVFHWSTNQQQDVCTQCLLFNGTHRQHCTIDGTFWVWPTNLTIRLPVSQPSPGTLQGVN